MVRLDRNRWIGRAMAAVIFFGCCVRAVSADDTAAFAGGSGTEDEPFLVATARQLDSVRHHPDRHFRLSADIDLSGFGDEAEGWAPIGHFRGWLDFQPFTGRFDGGGHRVINLTVHRPESEHVGLFGYLDDNAVIRDVILENVAITGGRFVGALAGYNSTGEISGSHASGKLTGEQDVGGLVGNNLGAIEACSAAVDVRGTGMNVGGLAGGNTGAITAGHATGEVAGGGINVGGLVGLNNMTITGSYATGDVRGERDVVGGLAGSNSGTITDSSASGDVGGLNFVGGLAGRNEEGRSVERSFATGNVAGEERVGGLVGENAGAVRRSHASGNVTGANHVGGLAGFQPSVVATHVNITECHAEGNVTGESDVGGLAGRIDWRSDVMRCFTTGDVTGETNVGGLIGNNHRGNISDCYARGDISGESSVGGLVGSIRGFIDNSYSTGRVSGNRNTGGLVGNFYHKGEARACYYDRESSGRDDEDTRGAPVTSAGLMRRATFEGWDFEGIWAIDEGETYPYLLWQAGTASHEEQ